MCPIRVTLTYFALSFYERALRLPNFSTISGLARLRVKPSLCRFFWRAFAYTYRPIFSLFLLRKFSLFALFFCLEHALLYYEIYSFLPMLPLRFSFFSPRCGSCSPWLSPTPRCGNLDRWLVPFTFFLSDSLSLCSRHSVLSSVFPFTSISLAGTVFFFPIISDYNGSPGIRFSQGTTQLISWPDEKRYSCLCYPL